MYHQIPQKQIPQIRRLNQKHPPRTQTSLKIKSTLQHQICQSYQSTHQQ